MSFKDEKFSNRFTTMGDEAEGVFEEIHHLGYVRYGLNRPPIQMHKLPARIRYSPDYLTTSCFVEVQGCGRDRIIKMKVDKFGCMHWWNDTHPVEFFLWDSSTRRWAFVTLAAMDEMVDHSKFVWGEFPEGKAYYGFRMDDLIEAAHRHGTVDDDD